MKPEWAFRAFVVIFAVGVSFGGISDAFTQAAPPELLLSTAANRSNAVPLQGSSLSGSIYVFVSPSTGIKEVDFRVNDPTNTSPPFLKETGAPFDLAGSASAASAKPYHTTVLPNGTNTITAVVKFTNGTSQSLLASFTVNNEYELTFSSSSNRSNPQQLDGGSDIAGKIYVIAETNATIKRVRFFFDDPAMAGPPKTTETGAPFDYLGGSTTIADAFNTAAVPDGTHSITAAFDLIAGGTKVVTASFTTLNTLPKLIWSPTSVVFASPVGGPSITQQVALSTDSSTASFTVDEDAPWLSVSPGSGSSPATLQVIVNPAGLAIGSHTATVQVSAPGFHAATLSVKLNIIAQEYALLLSASSDRSGATPLNGETVSGNIYVFLGPVDGVSQVRFYLDDPTMLGPARTSEGQAAFDFNGTAADGTAKPLNTTQLNERDHSVTAAIKLNGGGEIVVTSDFFVDNLPPQLFFSPDSFEISVAEGASQVVTTLLDTDDDSPASVTVSESVTWLSVATSGSSVPTTVSITANSTGLVAGTYFGKVSAHTTGLGDAEVVIKLTIGDTQGCYPLACSRIKVDLPYQLDFGVDHSELTDKNGIGTGFTYVAPSSNGQGFMPENLEVEIATGWLHVDTTAGLAIQAVDTQDNALAVGIDAPSQVSVVRATLINPTQGTGHFEQAGVWFGNDEDNYAKVVIISSGPNTYVQHLLEINGAQTNTSQSPALLLSNAEIQLGIRADPTNRLLQGTYRISGGPEIVVGTFPAPGEFFSFDAAGINPLIGTRSFGGILTSHRTGPSPMTFTFDDFSVTEGSPVVAPPPGGGGGGGTHTTPTTDGSGVGFDRYSFPVSSPTSLAWGPDNHLYVSEIFGRLHRITFDENMQVVLDEPIMSLRNAYGTGRLTLGITIDPASTPSNVILWASHSSPSLDDGEPNSGTVSRLSGPNLEVVEHRITGLPRAIANHAINSIHFGPDGKLYIAQGGNTGAGAANTANTEFGDMQEQPLSAAVLVADVYATGFDGSCHNAEDIFGQPPCDVITFATGLRNTYDFVFHSNGSIYGPDNGLGVTGTYPPTPTAPCFGLGNPASYTQGGHNPGSQPDNLNKIEQGRYYGHPNPYRNECVFKTGAQQGVAALPNYTPPMHNLGNNKSSNGILEYLSERFCGDLKHELLINNYSIGDNITRLRLSPDGNSVVAAGTLVGGFNDPLPIAQDPDGNLFIGEMGGDVSVLRPKDLGCWETKTAMPEMLLDVGGTALDGKLYVVGGKTSNTHRTDLHIYNPATNSWSQGANLLGPGVENPAVVALNNKLYAFGGATQPFSGAVTNAAVYNPATNAWTPLAPMSVARSGGIAQTIGGKIYVAGGMGGDGASVDTLEIYDPASNGWTNGTSMSVRRDNPGSAVLDGKLYIFGGRTRNADGSVANGTLNTVEAYDVGTNTWAGRASMPTGRRTMVVGTLNGRAQVMGGEGAGTGGGTFPQNEEYDAATDTWRALRNMVTPRHGAAAGTIGNVIYVAGGGPTGGSSFSDKLEAFAFETTP